MASRRWGAQLGWMMTVAAALLVAGGCDDGAGSVNEEPDVDATSDAGADTAAPDTSEPDTSEPDTSEPDTSEPDTSGPDTSEPDTSEPDAGPACDDGMQNGDETDIDCGGASCGPCDDGAGCAADMDCASGFCHPDTLSCAQASCGDGIVQADEACDDAGESATCNADCTLAGCGDGVTNAAAGEACDDGNADNADACLDTCVAAACGDGFVRSAVELCDDGNGVDDDACTNACAPATCGDGIVEAGVEQCDDMNGDDTDDCLSTCVQASCGDGVVRAGVEACDDGDGVDTNACTNACEVAVCGDGIVQAGVEQCDDQNGVDDDFCSNACVSATCSDGLHNGDESDTDCGGACGASCAQGASCTGDADCATAHCSGGVCEYLPSCLAILADDRSAPSGPYTIDLDGLSGAEVPLDVYCEMETDGGGWQLISVVRNDDPAQIIAADGYCTSADETLACKGQMHPAQVTARTEVLVQDLTTGGDWLVYDSFSATATSALRYFSRELRLGPSSDCGADTTLDHVCGNTSRDPGLRIARTSGYQVLHGGPLIQWWRLGGWWVGAEPSSGNEPGRLHASSYGGSHDLRRRPVADLGTLLQAGGHQALWQREDTCGNGVEDGLETGVDCGGTCAGCVPGLACVTGSDCASGVCAAGQCGGYQPSCAAMLAADPSAASAAYTIDPDGAGGGAPFPVYCDMETDGGGWTLAFATREFMAIIGADPGVSWQNFANQSIPDFVNPTPIMEGHAVPSTAAEVLWMCDASGDPNAIRWWRTGLPAQLVDNAHTSGGHAITTAAQSANATMTPDFYVEGSTNYPTYRYWFLTQGGTNSCNDGNVAAWGGNCFHYACPSSSGFCAASRMCDGVSTDGNGRFWLFWR